VPCAQSRRANRRTDRDAYRIRTQSRASIGYRPGLRDRVDNRLGVGRLLRDFIETTAGTERVSIRPHASTTGSTPVMPNKKKASSDCSWVSGTTAPATEASMS
jgi:hypothetical protein